jgi:ATP-binding cassette subfamily B protein
VIYVIQNGRIVEQGPHDTLLAKGGAYEKLYALQFASNAAHVPAPAEGD